MFSRAGVLLVSVLFCFVQTALAEPILSSIRVEGNPRVEEDTILLQVSSKPGEEFDTEKVSKDVKEIYRIGYFDQVVAKLETDADGAVLVFEVKEKPAIRSVKLQGNEEIKDDKLKEKLSIGTRRFLDRRKIAAGVEEAKNFYQDKGFYGTEIEFEIAEVEGNQVDITFIVEEGDKKRVREVVFEGNSEVSDSTLSDLVETSRYKWWSSWITGSGVVKRDYLEKDVQEMTKYYLTHGHVDIQVAEPVVESMKGGLRVVFQVSEGEVFSFNSISAGGTLLEDSEEKTLEGVKCVTGEIFDVEKLREDAFTISDKFTDIGYAFVNVDPNTAVDRERKTVDVNFRIDKGNLVTVNRIRISGNEKTEDNVIRRSLQIQERQLFSSSKIRRSQELLQRLGYFDEVTISQDPSVKEDELDLDVSVREGTTGTFSAGAGVSSGDGFFVSGQISENNVFGSGNSVTLNINTGSRRENAVLSFNNPRVNDSYWSLGIDALSVKREFDDFDRNQAGGSVSVGYPLWFLGEEYLDDVRLSLTYEWLEVTINDVDDDAPRLVLDQEGTSTVSSITPRIVRNTINNPLDPTKGSRQMLKVELAGIGGEEEFWLFQASNTWYYPLLDTSFGPIVFSQRTRFGYGKTFDGGDFPLFRRFFPGGINSVRGYDSRELGPKDEEGNEYGGSKELVGNFELIFPIVPAMGLNTVIFYDAGEAFDDDENIDFGELRQAVGWGIRWRSPLAPIRIEIGYPLDREEGEKGVVTNFSFGAPL